MGSPRVAYFPDSFHEVNGVAHTSRNFVAYAQRRGLPMLCVRAGLPGATGPAITRQEGSVSVLELPRSRAAVGLEKDLAFDPLFWRWHDDIADALHTFQPDVLHLTGPSELGIFAAYFAHKLRLPLAASWHTNVHEYASRRLRWLTRLLPRGLAGGTADFVERFVLGASGRFYSLAKVLYAPNPPLCDQLAALTHHPCHLMQRGVDTELFTPAHRDPAATTPTFTLGYVGRLSLEKNVALLPRIQQQLDAAGVAARMLIVGHGAEEPGLREALPTAEFAGVLRGVELSRAYARMDLLVFPSHTDTFGNVVLEALASGVPAVVTTSGGPRFIVRGGPGGGQTGAIACDDDFADAIAAHPA